MFSEIVGRIRQLFGSGRRYLSRPSRSLHSPSYSSGLPSLDSYLSSLDPTRLRPPIQRGALSARRYHALCVTTASQDPPSTGHLRSEMEQHHGVISDSPSPRTMFSSYPTSRALSVMSRRGSLSVPIDICSVWVTLRRFQVRADGKPALPPMRIHNSHAGYISSTRASHTIHIIPLLRATQPPQIVVYTAGSSPPISSLLTLLAGPICCTNLPASALMLVASASLHNKQNFMTDRQRFQSA
ncbi:hypothetical protein Hypma_002959 [Hypsizygus marmoreus]|uniref:Uncharacterized protein n=1 Tax=Hypsizygus marmoreus TaxID=39966 RepID=A0A369J382_HYPMA|nr:hypothetical protein Hypma_002959 [Hypsizygus marmoreus]